MMRTSDCYTLLTGFLLLSQLEQTEGRAYHQPGRDLYPQESYYNSYLLPPASSEGPVERQDPATVAGLSILMIGMAFSAAFTGAVIAPVLRMGVATAMETVSSIDIRMPVFSKDIFDEQYPEYEEYEYEEVEEEIIDTKKRNRNNRKKI